MNEVEEKERRLFERDIKRVGKGRKAGINKERNTDRVIYVTKVVLKVDWVKMIKERRKVKKELNII